MRARVVPVVLAGVVLGTALLGCSDDDDGEVAATSSTTTSTTSTTATTTAPSTSATAAPPTEADGGGPTATEEPTGGGDSDETGRSELGDGRHFGFWSTFEIGDTTAFGEFDLAYFLTGEEAEAAAAERGDEVNNDYYIVNDNPLLRTLVAEGDAVVRVLDGGEPDLRLSNVADFAVERSESSGYWVTIDDGIVTEIEQQFVP